MDTTSQQAAPGTTQQYGPGALVLGRYIVDSLLGEGGMGQVYAAHHAQLSRKRFALKTLRPELFGMGVLDERFRREADVLASLNHPGIVSIVDYGIDAARVPVMVMEMLDGETLRARLARVGALPLGETLRITREVASALDYTHVCQPPIIHRDLKPENLFLVAPDARVKVLDFGIAKVAGLQSNLTQTSTALGTPQYMSPEQLRDAKQVDVTTDVFALASIVYEMLTGQLAFPGEGIGGVVLAIFDGHRPRVSAVRGDVPAVVDDVLARAWALDPSARFQSAGALANALATALEAPAQVPVTRGATAPLMPGIPPLASQIGTAATLDQRIHRTPSRIPLVLGLGVAAAAVAAGALFAVGHTGTKPTPAGPSASPPDTVLAAQDAGALIVQEPAPRPATTHRPTPRGAFDVVHDELARALVPCATGLARPLRVSIEITWNGTVGLPIRSTFAPATVRECMSTAVLRYGQIPPQADTIVSRRYVFVVP